MQTPPSLAICNPRLRFLPILLSLWGLFAAVQAEPTAGEKLGWRLAMHSYTLKKFSIFDAIDKTASLGLTNMSLSGSLSLDGRVRTNTLTLAAVDWERVQAKLRSSGITRLVNIGVVPLTTNEVADRKVFEFARQAGVETLVSEPTLESLDLVEKLCQEYQIRVAIHNHPKPSRYWNPETVLAAVKGRTLLMGSCADIGHWMRSGLDPLECIRLLEGRVICLHFKDLNAKDPEAHDVPWGTGAANVKGIMAELKRQKFHGAFCIEYEYHWENSLPEIAQCVQFFNATCSELAVGLPVGNP